MIHVNRVHIVGIGGIGASAMAKWYLLRGAVVSGSDRSSTDITRELADLGATVYEGHEAAHVPEDTELILYSPAVLDNNPERTLGNKKGIPQLSYPEFLGELSRERKTIAISGTNGKSTTTAMIAKILIDAGYDPVVFLGTKSQDLSHGNFHDGQGVWMVVEACEYREHMKHIQPHIAVITNIEADHLDYYRGVDDIRDAFQRWLDAMKPFEGYVVLNMNDPQSRELKHVDAVYFAAEHVHSAHGLQSFTAKLKGEREEQVALQLSLPGNFNAQNAAAACVAAKLARIPEAQIKLSLRAFNGTWRRFEHVGVWRGADVYSDYAHHPTAIRVTIQGAREYFGGRRLVFIFEPHQHSRTKELFSDFVDAFQGADHVIVNEIYRVDGRTEDDHVSSQDLVVAIKEKYPELNIEYVKDQDAAKLALERVVREGDVVIIMGAGTIDELARQLV